MRKELTSFAQVIKFGKISCSRGVSTPTPLAYALVTDQVHLKPEQPQILWIESHVTIGTIQQTQDAANVLLIYRHKSWHAA